MSNPDPLDEMADRARAHYRDGNATPLSCDLDERIKALQEDLHAIWKTLAAKGHHVAADALMEAHMALADVLSE